MKLAVWVVKSSSNQDGFDVCGADKAGVAGLELAHTRDEPLVCELMSCCSPMASS
jgi:hypothetical protein